MSERIWVNFVELRKRLRFEDVLGYFKIEVVRKGGGPQHQGFCPLPRHEGKRTSPSFSANLERGIFQCFGCKAKGNVLEFAVLMKGGDPGDGDALRSAAVELQRHFFPDEGGRKGKPHAARVPAERRVEPAPAPAKSLPVKVNEPLGFELKDLDVTHPYLLGREFTQATLRHFGVGFCSRGMLKDRVAIPLHDMEGRLIGYAGRVVDDDAISADNPKYRLPSRREYAGTIFEFRKSLFVYNGFRIQAPCDDLAVVEGYPSVWWLHQHGYPQTVALMGSDCSDEQIETIVNLVKPRGRIWVMPDGDKAGRQLTERFLPNVSARRFVRLVKLGEGRQPTDLPLATLKEVFGE